MRKFITLAIGLRAGCKPAAEKAPVDADPVAPPVPEAKIDTLFAGTNCFFR